MARATRKKKELEVDAYAHTDKKRLNNPPVGLVSTQTDKLNGRTQYQHDPHIDPHLSWAGKAEGTSFEVQNVSLHVHERIEPKRIIKSFLTPQPEQRQMSLFDAFQKKEPLHQAVEFYSHSQGWSNRLIAGDSLLVMNSLLQKEGMKGKVQTVYFDPPYGINYGSNFQPFTNKRTVKDNDGDLVAEPEMLRAFRDTWQLGVHSYLSYLRDRLTLAKSLLAQEGSVFVQTSDDNLHHIREIMDEVFGSHNFMSLITFRTKIPLGTKFLAGISDYLIWYSVDKKKVKFRRLFTPRMFGGDSQFVWIELPDGTRRRMTKDERIDPSKLPQGAEPFRLTDLVSAGRTESCVFEVEFEGQKYSPSGGKSWKTNPEGMKKLIEKRRIMATGKSLSYVFFLKDYPVQEMTNLWEDTQGASDKVYVVQTSEKVVRRAILMTTDPGDLVFDPSCGSGTTASVCEMWGRRWITCDTSRVATALAKQRLMTGSFPFFELAHPSEGVSSGFNYSRVPHITLGSIAGAVESEDEDDLPARDEILYDSPSQIPNRIRVAGPFTVEAVPSLRTKPFGDNVPELVDPNKPSHSGETAKYIQWMDELRATGVRAIGGNRLQFSRIEPATATKFIHATAEFLDEKGINRVSLISFGPDYGPLEQRQVEQAVTEARAFKTKPDFIIFCAFQFDPEAAKDIEEIDLSGTRVLKAQMTADLLTEDLRKKRSSNESFWLIGQPEVEVKKRKDGKYSAVVNGFDYYNPATGEISSGGANKIAMWMLDTNYDDRSLLPEQVFFPQNDSKRDWTKLGKSLNGLVDEELLEAFVGVESLPFTPGDNRKIAVKIIDDRGIESFVIKKV